LLHEDLYDLIKKAINVRAWAGRATLRSFRTGAFRFQIARSCLRRWCSPRAFVVFHSLILVESRIQVRRRCRQFGSTRLPARSAWLACWSWLPVTLPVIAGCLPAINAANRTQNRSAGLHTCVWRRCCNAFNCAAHSQFVVDLQKILIYKVNGRPLPEPQPFDITTREDIRQLFRGYSTKNNTESM
jgi:hypothetical protein